MEDENHILQTRIKQIIFRLQRISLNMSPFVHITSASQYFGCGSALNFGRLGPDSDPGGQKTHNKIKKRNFLEVPNVLF